MEWLIIPNFMLNDRERWQLWLRVPGIKHGHPRYITEGSKTHCFDIADAAKAAKIVVQERIDGEAKDVDGQRDTDSARKTKQQNGA
jgi:hypothetical protein